MTRRREGWAAPDPWAGLRRIQRAQKRLADGSLAGATNLASPVSSVPAGAPLAAVRAAESGGGGDPIAWFNDSDSTTDGGYIVWNQQATLGDTSWFLFAPDVGLGPDPTRIQILSPGIITITLRANSGDPDIATTVTMGSNGIVAAGTGQTPSIAGVGVFDQELLDFNFEDVRVSVSGGDGPEYNATLSMEFHPGEPVYVSL